jgi:hypothetical protein
MKARVQVLEAPRYCFRQSMAARSRQCVGGKQNKTSFQVPDESAVLKSEVGGALVSYLSRSWD